MLYSHKSGQCAVELYHAPHLWYPPFYTSPMASSAVQHWTASPTKEGCHWQVGGENRQTWQLSIQHDILNPPLLRLTSRKPLWLNLQPVVIKSRWRHNWKSAQVVNSYLVCDPTIRQPGFDLPRQQWSLLNCFRTEQGHCGACIRKWRLTDTDLSLWRDPDDVPLCRILSPDKTEWQLISATLCRWRRCFVADQLWFMTQIREEDCFITMVTKTWFKTKFKTGF